MWAKAWSGEGPIFERFVMGDSAGQKLAALAKDHPRWSHIIKEGTQDVALGALFNFIAFRSQPIFTQVEAKHVLGSVAIDALEAGVIKGISSDINADMSSYTQVMEERNKRAAMGRGRYQKGGTTPVRMNARSAVGGIEGIARTMFNFSNPVTLKGLEMVVDAARTYAIIYSDVRNARKTHEWSGGKASSMKSENSLYYGASHGKYNNKRRELDERLDDI
jgi:hypothetical protein